MKVFFEKTRNKSTRDENKKPLRIKSMKCFSEETWKSTWDEIKSLKVFSEVTQNKSTGSFVR